MDEIGQVVIGDRKTPGVVINRTAGRNKRSALRHSGARAA